MLVCGSVEGAFDALLGRLQQLAVEFSGDRRFEELFVCGEFFGTNVEENQRLLSGEKIISMPIYILGGYLLDARLCASCKVIWQGPRSPNACAGTGQRAAPARPSHPTWSS